mgnify:CR=1 FL=1
MFNTPEHKNLLETIRKSREHGRIELEEQKKEKVNPTDVPLEEHMSLESFLKKRNEMSVRTEDDEYEADMERIERLKQQAADDRDRRREQDKSRKDREKQVKQRRAQAAAAAKRSQPRN